MRRGVAWVGAAVLAALVFAGVGGVAAAGAAAARTVVIGHSVRGRAITAIGPPPSGP